MKKSLSILFLFLLFSNRSFATAQVPDLLVYKGDTLSLHYCPLVYFPTPELINPRNLFGGKGCFNTSCWRNYVATWEIIENELYLVEIRNACYPTKMKGVAVSFKDVPGDSIGHEYADLKTLFPDRCHNGKVRADWVNGIMYAPFGKMLNYVHLGFESTFEFEYKFTMNYGRVEKVEKADNRKAKRTVFKSEDNRDTLTKFISSRINWSRLPKLPKDSIVKVNVIFSADDKGVIDYVRLKDRLQNDFTSEAVRVIKIIPGWDVYMQHGRHIRDTVNFTVRFVQPVDEAELQQLIAHDKRIEGYSKEQKAAIVMNREKISDSIRVIYFKEARKMDSRVYAFSYAFIDYNPDNKYIQRVLNEKNSFVNDFVIRDGQQKKLVQHDENISKSISSVWYPLTYFEGNFYNYRNASRFFCEISDSVINTPRKYFDTYLIRQFSITDKNHYRFRLSRFGVNDSLDVYFLDKNHKYALMRFRGKLRLFSDPEEIRRFPFIAYSFSEWNDARTEFEKIEDDVEELPEDIDSLKELICRKLGLDFLR